MLLEFFFIMIRRPPRSTQSRSSAASDVYKRQQKVDLPKSTTSRLLATLENEGFLRKDEGSNHYKFCLLYTSPSPRDRTRSRMPSSA